MSSLSQHPIVTCGKLTVPPLAGVQRAVHGGEGLAVLAGAGLHSQAVDHDRLHRVRGLPEHGRLLGCHTALLGALGQDARGRRGATRRLHLFKVRRASGTVDAE